MMNNRPMPGLPAILLAILMIPAAAPSFLSAQGDPLPPATDGELTVDLIFGEPGLYEAPPAEFRWSPDGTLLTFIEEDEHGNTRIAAVETATGKKHVLLDPVSLQLPAEPAPLSTSAVQAGPTADTGDSDARPLTLSNHCWSPRGSSMLFTAEEGLFLHDLDTGSLRRIPGRNDGESAAVGPDGDPEARGVVEMSAEAGEPGEKDTADKAVPEDAKFSPDGSHISYVRQSDLYVADTATGKEYRLTHDGGPLILNGIVDWVHGEELDLDTGYCWSPDGDRIAFYRFDLSPVTRWPIVDHLSPTPEVTEQRFPRPGEANARVRIGVVTVPEGHIHWIDSVAAPGADAYVARLGWMPGGNRLAVQLLERGQSRLCLKAIPLDDGDGPSLLLEETDPCWVNVTHDLHFLDDGSSLFWTSERDGWRHLYRGGLAEPDAPGGEEKPVPLIQLTRGPWQITELHGIDQEAGYAYFTATEKSPLERHLYRIRLDGEGMTRLTSEPGCHAIEFDPDRRFYLDSHHTYVRPPRVTLHRADGSPVAEVWDSRTPALDACRLEPPEFFTITGEGGTNLPAAMVTPPGMDPKYTYPALVYVYGGPGAQVVRNGWRGTMGLWFQMMAQRGFVVFWLDNRGSFGRGRNWERAVDRRLGQLELEDQLAGIRHLKSLPFIDPNRLGIFGWSYGGYMTLMIMMKAPGAVLAGAAVAPVSDWLEYDTIYTERYMELPADNAEGYRDGSPVHFAGDLEGRLLLAHGTADNNVHFRHTAKVVDALIEAGKDFDLCMHTGKGHSIRGPKHRTHLFNRLTLFFEEALSPSTSSAAVKNPAVSAPAPGSPPVAAEGGESP